MSTLLRDFILYIFENLNCTEQHLVRYDRLQTLLLRDPDSLRVFGVNIPDKVNTGLQTA